MKRFKAAPALVILATLLLSAGSIQASDLVGQLGILDVTAANGGINPATGNAWAFGDTYRIVFATSVGRDALSGDVADYNARVQDVANAAGLGAVTWRAIASTNADWGGTATVDARDNTFTNPSVDGAGVAIFLIDGITKIADDNNDLWDGTIDNRIDRTEHNTAYIAPAGSPFAEYGSVWTGTDQFGENRGRAALGGDSADLGLTIVTNSQWTRRSEQAGNDKPLGLYAVSTVLTINARGLLFSPDTTRFAYTPNGVVLIYDANGYTLNLETGDITLAFNGVARGLQNLDCIHQQDDGLFLFSTKSNQIVVTPAGAVIVIAQNVYRLEANGTLTPIVNGQNLGIDACDIATAEAD
ncbi:MAG: hypothetical protein GY716_09310 [bacterium]|nr:hypothetical protein [bacterium]